MCDRCYPFETRRKFIGKFATSLALAAGMAWTRRALGQPLADLGRRTGWGRLVTPNRFWNLHGEQDAALADFIRQQTHLDLDPTVYSVDPANVDELSRFPFLFTNDLAAVDSRQQDNIKEYLERGGFFYIDGCVDHRVTRSFKAFLSRQSALFAQLLPGSQAQELTPTHPIFRAYFPVEQSQLGLRDVVADDQQWKDVPQALYGVYHQGRMISLISLQHLQCEWLTKPAKIPFCLQQITNIYVYAMTRRLRPTWLSAYQEGRHRNRITRLGENSGTVVTRGRRPFACPRPNRGA